MKKKSKLVPIPRLGVYAIPGGVALAKEHIFHLLGAGYSFSVSQAKGVITVKAKEWS